MDIWQDMRVQLTRLRAADLYRDPHVIDSACGARVVIDGREVVCLCSNDYLALAGDPAMRAAVVEAVERWGVGAGASRLVSGSTRVHADLERALADFKRAEAAIVTPTGWQANHAAIAAMVASGDLVVCDKLNHASIIDAARASGARLRTCPHRDVERLVRLLDRHRAEYRRCLIVTDSLFSMDGDLAPLADLVEVKRRFDAALLIDEAHATGVLGAAGRGAAELLEVEDDVDAVVGTLSKAVGSLGGFVAGPRVLIDALRNTARSFIYTTALPPALCAAGLKALEIIRDEPHRRRKLLRLAEGFRSALRAAGIDCGDSASQIVPVIIGEAADALGVARELLERGYFVPAIRPPTVPRGASRLRVSLSAGHEPADVDALAASLAGLLSG